MRTSTVFASLAACLALTTAAPIEKASIQKRSLSANDTAVLQLAHYLENLEFNLYSLGYKSFTEAEYKAAGFPATFRENVGVIAEQEGIHRDTLALILEEGGVTPLAPCTYDFPFTSPTSFVDLANMITSVGIGAYIGGSADLIDNTTLLQDAGSILTNEARHDAFLRLGVGGSPFPTPFDTSLTALWVYNLAHTFVVSCPVDLPAVFPGLILLPKLTLLSPAPSPTLEPPVPAGTILEFQWDPSQFFITVDPNAPLYIAFVNQISPPVFEQVTITGTGLGSVPLPVNVSGVAFAALTTFPSLPSLTDLSLFGTLAGPTELVLS